MLIFEPELLSNISLSEANVTQVISNLEEQHLHILTKALKTYLDQDSNEAFLSLINETSIQLEAFLVNKMKLFIQAKFPNLYTSSMNDKNDLIGFCRVFHDSLTTYLHNNGIPELTPLAEKFFWTFTQNFDIGEAIDCIKEDFNLTLIENFISSAFNNSISDYLSMKSLIRLKPYVEVFLNKLMETKSLIQAFECLSFENIEPEIQNLITNKIKDFLKDYYPTTYALIQNETNLSNLKTILFNVTRLNDLSVILQSFCESYAIDPIAAFKGLTDGLTNFFEKNLLYQIKIIFLNYSTTIYSMIKDLNDLKSVSDVLFQIGIHLVKEKLNTSGMSTLINIYSNFTNAFLINMNIIEGFGAISDDLMTFVETQLVVCIKNSVQDYSLALYELIRDETDLGHIIEMLSPVFDFIMQMKFSDLGLNELPAILKKFYTVFSETLDIDYSIDCILPDLKLLIQNRTLSYLKLLSMKFSPTIFALVKDLDLNGIRNNTEIILNILIQEIMNVTDSSLYFICLKFIEVYERTNCVEDAWLAAMNDFFILFGDIIQNRMIMLLDSLSKEFQDVLGAFEKFNIFSFIERFLTTFCFENLKKYFLLIFGQ